MRALAAPSLSPFAAFATLALPTRRPARPYVAEPVADRVPVADVTTASRSPTTTAGLGLERPGVRLSEAETPTRASCSTGCPAWIASAPTSLAS